MNNKEKTLIIIKPDITKQKKTGDIISILEKTNLSIIAMKMIKPSKNELIEFYKEHENKVFFEELIEFMTSGPIIAIVLNGNNIIQTTRKIIGNTNYELAEKGTIRNIFATSITKNAIHGSDSLKSADREINIFFKKNEFIE